MSSEKILVGSCIIGQSGGPTAVINASAYGAIRAALDADCITKVYGAANGIKGVLDDRLYIMDEEDPDYGIIILRSVIDEKGEELFESIDDDDELQDVYEHFAVLLFDDEDEE